MCDKQRIRDRGLCPVAKLFRSKKSTSLSRPGASWLSHHNRKGEKALMLRKKKEEKDIPVGLGGWSGIGIEWPCYSLLQPPASSRSIDEKVKKPNNILMIMCISVLSSCQQWFWKQHANSNKHGSNAKHIRSKPCQRHFRQCPTCGYEDRRDK